MSAKSGLTVVFARPRGDPVVLDAKNDIVLEDGRMKLDGTEVAVHDNHQWVVHNTRFSRFDVEQEVDLHLRSNGDTSRPFGPYTNFSCVDGVSYVQQRIFAFYDEQNRDWYVFIDGRHWKTLVVTAASQDPRGALPRS